MGVCRQGYAPAALYSWGKTPGTLGVGGWVGLTAGLDTEARGKKSAGNRNPVVRSVVGHYIDWCTLAVAAPFFPR
jgi:hypothetical protein